MIRCTRLAMELEASVSCYIVLLVEKGKQERKCGEEDTTCEDDVTRDNGIM